LPFTGLDPLWATRHAASLVLVIAAVLIVLINAVYQDGQREHPAAFILRGAGIVAAVALTPLVAIAAYAVMLRVNQYGWTPERVFAAACVVVVACFAAGYLLAALTSRPWLRRIETANVVGAIVMLATILALFSPVADPARIAVADQVARLEAGRTPVKEFDFALLRYHCGRYGLVTLDRLRHKAVGPNAEGIAEMAGAALAARTPFELKTITDRPTPAERAANITVFYPKEQSLPATFVQQDWQMGQNMPIIPCLVAQGKCDAVMLDLDGDGAAEILLAVPQYYHSAIVYKETGGKWIYLGMLEMPCKGAWEALRAGNFELVMPEFKEISVAGARVEFRVVDVRRRGEIACTTLGGR
jgi:hypothetical protein